jgi:hypothetical protein
MLGDDVIHSVHNPARYSYTGAIHIYGGDFVGTPRSQWDPSTLTEHPYDLETVQNEFHRAEAVFRAQYPSWPLMSQPRPTMQLGQDVLAFELSASPIASRQNE